MDNPRLPMTIIVLVLVVAAELVTRTHRRDQRNKMAGSLGLSATKGGFRGRKDDRDIECGALRRDKEPWTFVELKLLNVPDLVLSTENLKTRVQKLMGKDDLEVGHERFDDIFHLAATDHDATRKWLNEDRCAALLELNERVDFIRIEQGRLRFEIPQGVHEAEHWEQVLAFASATAAKIEAGGAWSVKPFEFRTRETVGRWYGIEKLFWTSISILPIFMLAIWATWMSWPDPEREARRESQRVQSGDAMVACLDEHPPTWDMNLSACEEFADYYDRPEAKDAVTKYHRLELRHASRVRLDRDAALAAFKGLRKVQGGKANVAADAWDAGLVNAYAAAEDFEDPALPSAAVAVALMAKLDSAVPGLSRSQLPTLGATSCILGVAAQFMRSDVLRFACHGATNQGYPPNRPKLRDDEYLASVEAKREVSGQPFHDRLPKYGLFRRAEMLAGGDAVEYPEGFDFDAQMPECRGAWALPNGYGHPEVWEKAGALGGPEAETMLTIAALQRWATGDTSVAELDDADVQAPGRAVCIAQMRVALGDVEGALRLLERDKLAVGHVLADVTRAEAAFATKQWAEMAQYASRALSAADLGVETETMRERLGLMLVLAELETSEQKLREELEERFGASPEAKDAGRDPILVARWFADAARNDTDDEVDRWGAPSEASVSPGGEALMALIAGRLADGDSVEYWLDVCLPERVNPFTLAAGRELAAKLRGDAKGEKRWGAVRANLKLTSPSEVRLARIATDSD